jgi:hypothetical protein
MEVEGDGLGRWRQTRLAAAEDVALALAVEAVQGHEHPYRGQSTT